MKMKNFSKKPIIKGKKPRMLMVVDGSNLAHRSYHKFKNLRANNGHGTGLVYGFLKILHSYLMRFRPVHLIITFDTHASKTSNFRNGLLEGYKGHRSNISMDYEDFNFQMRLLRRILRLLGVQIIMDFKGLGYESDDYIAKMTLIQEERHGKTLIISSDKDFCQLLSKNTKIFNPGKESLILPKTCKEIMGYSPEECTDYLILNGDKSDDIPGYYGMGEKKTREFLDQFGSISKFLSNSKLKYKGIERDQLSELYEKNSKLINLKFIMKERPIKYIPLVKTTPKVKSNRLFKILDKFNLRSFRIPEYLLPYDKIKHYE